MSKFERFGQKQGKTGQFGQGQYIQQMPGMDTPLTFSDFSGGYDSRQMRDGTPLNSSSDEIDLDLTKRGFLEPMAGTTAVLPLTGHVTQQMALHPSLSGWAELIFFAPPYIGVLGASGAIRWTDIGMPVTGELVGYTTFGEKMIFYNRRGDPYIRTAGDDGAATNAGIPRAVSYAVFGGRVYALGTEIDGVFQPMGVQWSSVSGDPTDFLGAGAQPELLIDETVSGERIVVGRTMGLGMMAILCRRSIWVATFTGDLNRPGDLQPRVKGGGCVSPETARSTPAGVIYLSDDGVRLFDGNSSMVISPQINNELLPLDQANLKKYAATYDPIRNRYILLTPTGSWHLDLNDRRWLRSSLIASSGTLFAQQIAGTTWQALVGDWNSLNNTTWLDLSNRETDVAELHFLGKPAAETLLHKLDGASSTNFGVARIPYWTTPRKPGSTLNNLVETKGFNLEYTSETLSQVRLSIPDIEGDWMQLRTDYLLASLGNKLRTMKLPALASGLGAAVKVEFLSGTFDLAQIQHRVSAGGPRITGSTGPIITNIAPAAIAAGDIVPLVITGQNFLVGSTVQISGLNVQVVSTTLDNPGQITVLVHALAAAALGARDVTVTTVVGTSNASPLTINASPLPVAPVFWYEAEQGIFVANGAAITDAVPLREKAQGLLLGPAGSGLGGPIYRNTGFGGGLKPYLEFNNAHGIRNPVNDGRLSVTSFCVFIVAQRDAGDANSCLYMLTGPDHLTGDIQDIAASAYASRWNAGHTVLLESSYNTAFGWIPKGQRLIIRQEMDGTHAGHKQFLNGVQQAIAQQLTNNPGILPSGNSYVQMGYRDNAALPGLNLQGQIAALIICSPIPTALQITAIETYLNKYRVP